MTALILLILLILITIVIKVMKPKIKGFIGEYMVSTKLSFLSGEYHVFDNVYLENNGFSTQIDHVIISPYGIFVIETKNYKGEIYGNEEQHEWTQVLAFGNVENKFYNPIKQNKSHIYKLQKFLPKNIDIISVVVFIDADIESVESNNVCNLNELEDILNMDFGKTITNKQINYIANILRRYQDDSITEEEHIRNIHKMQEDIENNICPRCGSPLVLRSGENGEFYGCSNYPKCKFKKKA